MHAAVLTFQGTPEQLEHDTQVGQRLLPIMREQAGFQGYYRLQDREGGKSLIITFWESEAALHAAREDSAQIRYEIDRDLGHDAPLVQIYEVLEHF